ncbi:MAG: AAA domain-containing protein [Thermoplasmatota archaeon]|nr:AAA family ATPase [Halobacteriales archaeon]
MAVSRYCPHGNLRASCPLCRAEAVQDAEARAAVNRARGEAGRMGRIEGLDLPYPWQRSALEAWKDGGRSGLVALSLGLPTGDLPYAVMAEVVNANDSSNVLVATALGEGDEVRAALSGRFRLQPTSLIDHHFLEPRADGVLVVADIAELETIDLTSWGRFASNGLLLLLDADGVSDAFGEHLIGTPFRHRFSLSRQPSAVDLLATRPWSRAFGPLVYRSTEEEARDLGILPRIQYKLHVEMLRPEAPKAVPRGPRQWVPRGPEGPWEPTDIPTRMPATEAGPFFRSRARDVAMRRAKETSGLLVIHEGVPVPGAVATVRLKELPDRHKEAPTGWLLASPSADGRSILRLATVAFKTLGKPGAVEDAVVLPVPVDLAQVPPWTDKWRMAATQIDRVVAGLLLAEKPGDAMLVEDLESLVGVALALRGIPADELYKLTPVVAEAAQAAHAGSPITPERVRQAARAVGGFAAALLVAAESGPLHLLRLAHPRFTPVLPDLPHPSLYDARRHAWRGRAFAALASAAKGADLVTAWGRYPELRFVFPSSALLEAATAYCARHKLKGPLDEAKLTKIPDKTRIAPGDRQAAAAVLKQWNEALALAEEHEREFLADMHARQPERERRREGTALPGLEVLNRTADSMTLESREGRLPITNISPGSEVALVEQGEREELARGVVSKISTRRVTIDFPNGAPRHHMPKFLTVNLVFDAKVFEAYHGATQGAVRALAATQPADDGPDGLLRAALLGETDPPESMRQGLHGDEVLTDSQRTAVNGVLSGGRVRLIHGPPGTGKTHTLVHLAMALAKAGHSVLCTADSNAAVDNLVVGLRRSGFLVVRIGHAVNLRDEAAEPARIDPMEAPLFVRWAAEQGIIVATTNYGAFRYIDPKGGLTPFIFDYVVHDEAGQATAPSSLAAVLRGRRLVLAGDPKQLPPTVVSMDAKEAGLDVTLFERVEELTGHDRTRMLETQFRMREPIVAFSNQRYYEGRIKTDPAAAAQDGLPDMPAAAFQHVTGRENERQRNGSISNDFEVEAMATLVERFRPECRERGWTMAILTPYQAQREAVRRRIPDIEVSTVDGAQGREWDVVLYSTVRSNPQHRLGFLEDERRLNVAVTRAKRNFVLVGDERTLRDHPAFNDLLASLEKIRFHYPAPPQRHDEPDRWERRGRRGDRRGRRGNQQEQREPRPQHPPRQPTHQPPRRDDQRADRSGHADLAQGADRHAERAPGAQQGEGRRGRRRRRRGNRVGLDALAGEADGDMRSPPEVDPFQAPRPERRSFTTPGGEPQSVPAEARPPAPLADAVGPARASRAKAAKKPAVAKARPAKSVKSVKEAKPAKAKAAGAPDGTCQAVTKSGSKCKLPARLGSMFCARHQE